MDAAGERADDLVEALAGSTGEAAFGLLRTVEGPLDWDALPRHLDLADGARLTFDRRRRDATIKQVDGSVTVNDLGRLDRMRSLHAVVLPDWVRQEGPSFELTVKAAWSSGRGEVAVRDPGDRKGKRAATTVPAGVHGTSRYLDADGRPRLVALGDLTTVSGFGTFLMDGGVSYARLRTTSGLASFHDGRRTTFMNAVTDEVVAQARAEGFASVATKTAGTIGVVVDCGAPGDYLALAAYHRDSGGTVGVVVDLRRGPVRDGAIVDPV